MNNLKTALLNFLKSLFKPKKQALAEHEELSPVEKQEVKEVYSKLKKKDIRDTDADREKVNQFLQLFNLAYPKISPATKVLNELLAHLTAKLPEQPEKQSNEQKKR